MLLICTRYIMFITLALLILALLGCPGAQRSCPHLQQQLPPAKSSASGRRRSQRRPRRSVCAQQSGRRRTWLRCRPSATTRTLRCALTATV